MKILLVQPDYYTKFPPLPLLKMSTYHKEHGNETELIIGNNMFAKGDKVNITSLYTFEYNTTIQTVDFYKKLLPNSTINFGGNIPTLLPDLKIEGVNITRGSLAMLDDLVPDYSLVPNCETSVIFASKGCVRQCEFCGTRIIHPKFIYYDSIKKYIMKQHKTISLFDNNFLAHPKFFDIVQELVDAGKPVDITQGLDARLLTEDKAKALSNLVITPVIFAFDSIRVKDEYIKAVELAHKVGLGKKTYITTYMLYNFQDNIMDLIERIKIALTLGVRIYLMRYIPLDELYDIKKHIDKDWTQEQLTKIEKLRSILSAMGTINPASYVYVKFPLPDYVQRLDSIWEFEAASTNTAAQRSLFDGK